MQGVRSEYSRAQGPQEPRSKQGKQFKWLPLTAGDMMLLVLPLLAIDWHRIWFLAINTALDCFASPLRGPHRRCYFVNSFRCRQLQLSETAWCW